MRRQGSELATNNTNAHEVADAALWRPWEILGTAGRTSPRAVGRAVSAALLHVSRRVRAES